MAFFRRLPFLLAFHFNVKSAQLSCDLSIHPSIYSCPFLSETPIRSLISNNASLHLFFNLFAIKISPTIFPEFYIIYFSVNYSFATRKSTGFYLFYTYTLKCFLVFLDSRQFYVKLLFIYKSC